MTAYTSAGLRKKMFLRIRQINYRLLIDNHDFAFHACCVKPNPTPRILPLPALEGRRRESISPRQAADVWPAHGAAKAGEDHRRAGRSVSRPLDAAAGQTSGEFRGGSKRSRSLFDFYSPPPPHRCSPVDCNGGGFWF